MLAAMLKTTCRKPFRALALSYASVVHRLSKVYAENNRRKEKRKNAVTVAPACCRDIFEQFDVVRSLSLIVSHSYSSSTQQQQQHHVLDNRGSSMACC